MSESAIQHPGAFIASDARKSEKVEIPTENISDAVPAGYRLVSKRWRLFPDGTRDYAAFHGRTEFSFLLPVSSRLRTPRR